MARRRSSTRGPAARKPAVRKPAARAPAARKAADRLTLARAKREIEAVEHALRAGHPPAVGLGVKIRTAARVAADALGEERVTFVGRVGTPDRKGSYERRWGLRPRWHLAPPAAPAPSPDIPPKPEEIADQRRITALRDENAALRAQLRARDREANDLDAVHQVIGTLAQAPTAPPDWLVDAARSGKGATPEVPVTIWSDWHLGEVVDPAEVNGVNAYDLAIAERRVRRLVEATIKLARHHGPRAYPGAVVTLLGDMVSGGIHPELAKSDEEEVIPAALRARDILVWALSAMADEFGRLYVPCACGNHGRATPKPEFKRIVHNSFDWLIYQMLRRHFAGDGRITFDVPTANEVLFRVHGLRFLAMHGDMLGVKGGDGIIGSIGPIMRGEIKTARQAAVTGRDYDVLLMGHWHTQLWLHRAVVANTLKGFCQYAAKALRAVPTPPSQPLFFVHPERGITSRWEVHVETPTAAPTEWVSVPAGPPSGRADPERDGRKGRSANRPARDDAIWSGLGSEG